MNEKTELKTIGDFEKDLSISVKSQLSVKFKCDECDAVFPAKDIELKEYSTDNFNMINPMLRFKFFRKSDGCLIGTWNTTTLSKDEYYTLHCPKCHMVHLSGMDMVDL